ncbi:MAG: hypothetical protein ABI772_04450 [Bacteroidota bacterium]
MRNKTIYIKIFFLTIISLSALAKENVGMKKRPASAALNVASGCRNTTAQFDLDINNVRARILNGGDLWWDPVGQTNYYEVPIGSNKNSIYTGALWIAGLDETNQIRAACQTYRQSGANDFWAGPISKDPNTQFLDVSVSTCEQYDRFWTTTKAEIETFVATGEATQVIKDWPGNGNVALGEEAIVAPYFDFNADGKYNYADGDYPKYQLDGNYPSDPVSGGALCNENLFGDKNVWWVFNDVGNSHLETNSPQPIGLEVRAQAFGFRTADDINNMTFYKYQIINRSPNALHDTYFGSWCDPDLGNASDDYVGCDVGLGLGYCYNADPDDDGAGGYGVNPPAVGIDFFQGPLADLNDGIDNDRDGVTDEPGEQIIMTKFVYYTNDNNQPTGNPATLDDYYQYLSGIWLDGQAITYGGTGRDPAAPPCNFMFPELTDPANPTLWTMSSAGIPGADMRWLQSAGTFTLQAGAVNYVTTGVVWAKATAGGPGASLNLIKLADQKAQALFDNCFKVLDGPNAPPIAIRELDQQLILSFENTATSKIEYYNEKDPTIPSQIPDSFGGFITLSNSEKSFKFQGYRLYQVANKNVSNLELNDPSRAKLIRQIDIKDNITKIVNFDFNGDLGVWFPTQVADSNTTTNVGLVHEFVLTKDYFTGQNLINFRPYYYMAVSYAYNNYRPFNPANGTFTQTAPYKQGRLGVAVYSGIPHHSFINNGGMTTNSSVGESFQIRRIEGQGNGGNVLDFTDETVNEILTSADHQSVHPVYVAGRGPIRPYVYEPFTVKGHDFEVMFDGLNSINYWGLLDPAAIPINISTILVIQGDTAVSPLDTMRIVIPSNSSIRAGTHLLIDNVQGITVANGLNKRFIDVVSTTPTNDTLMFLLEDINGSYVPGTGTLEIPIQRSTYNITAKNAEHIENYGIAMDIVQDASMEFGGGGANNGFLEATITDNSWLTFQADNGAPSYQGTIYDWILAGVIADPNKVYENVLGGAWAPVKYVASGVNGLVPSSPPLITNLIKSEYLASVDVVFTSDKSKWTRCPVFEMGSSGTEGNVARFGIRAHASLDKNFQPGDGVIDTLNPDDADFLSATGMSWFPGYAINLETGERLNMAFGENSALVSERGNDMKWNPTWNVTTPTDTVFGGMHYIWVFGHNLNGVNDVPKYDFGKLLINRLNTLPLPNNTVKRAIYKDLMWTSIPIARYNVDLSNGIPLSDVKVRLRVAKSYRNYVTTGVTDTVNQGNPSYEFSIPKSAEVTTGQTELASKALEMIRVVPNPYYAYSSYEKTREDQLDNRVRLVNLPSHCTISIFTLNGTLVRQIKRDVIADVSQGLAIEEGRDDNLSSTLDWDLKNTAGITVASGVYYIHIDAGALGEKVVKWLGVMRPIDLDTF